MAWKITTIEVEASGTYVHSTAGESEKIIVSASNTASTVKGSLYDDGSEPSSDLHTTGTGDPDVCDNYPFLLLTADAGGTRTFQIAERVKDGG